MAVLEQNKEIVITVDPGFDATKVVINGMIFKVPWNVVDVTESRDTGIQILAKTEDYILSHYIEGKSYLVGEQARKQLGMRSAKDMQNVKQSLMDSFGKFTSEDFEINVMSSIGYALVRYSQKLEKDKKMGFNTADMSDYKLFVGIALPHDALDIARNSVLKKIANQHSFKLELDDGDHELNFKIEKGKCFFMSQAIMALMGAITDDNGETDPDNIILQNLPTLVIDGGYKTMGIFVLTAAGRIDVTGDASNTDFAMNVVHKRIAEVLQKEYGRTDIQDYNIPDIIESDGGRVVYEKDGNTDVVEIAPIFTQTVKDLFNEMMDYINQNFERLLNIKSILVAGGTGSLYYPLMTEYVKTNKKHLEGKVIITDYKFLKGTISPEFAIAVGMYKVMKRLIQRAKEQNEQA